MQCKQCGSYAINHHLHGRDGTAPDLCDVCFWRERAEKATSDAGCYKVLLDQSARANQSETARHCAQLADDQAVSIEVANTYRGRISQMAVQSAGWCRDIATKIRSEYSV